MLRKIAFGTGAVMAALGLAVSVPGAAMAAPSTETVASATSGDVTTQGTWVYVKPYEKSMAGAAKCTMDASRMDHAECRTKETHIELWEYVG